MENQEKYNNLSTLVEKLKKSEDPKRKYEYILWLGKKLKEVTVSVDVINARIIENKNCVTLKDVLRNAPGVQITDGQLNIRAGSGWTYGAGSRVLVMIDDMPLLSADQGEVLFNMVPLENVEQVEIIKGASSALYGSSALNGIVNVRSKMPGLKPETKVGIKYLSS